MIELGENVSSPLPETAHAAVRTELAGPNVGNMGGRFRYSDDTPENRLAQRVLYNRNPALPGEAVDAIAEGLQPGYGEMVLGMHKGHQAVVLDQIAESVEANKKVVVDMPHPGLINAGVAFRGVCSAVESRGVEFETASIEGAMLPHLKVWLSREKPPAEQAGEEAGPGNDGFMTTQAGVALISQNAIKTIPNTDKTQELRKRFTDEVEAHNKLAMEALRALVSREVGMLILIIGSGSHDQRKANDPSIVETKPVAPGLIKILAENKLEVAEMAVFDVPELPFGVQLVEGPRPVTTMEQMERRKRRLAEFMTGRAAEAEAGVSFEYRESGLPAPKT